MDIMPIFAGIVGLVIVVAVAVSAGTMGAVFGVIAVSYTHLTLPTSDLV